MSCIDDTEEKQCREVSYKTDISPLLTGCANIYCHNASELSFLGSYDKVTKIVSNGLLEKKVIDEKSMPPPDGDFTLSESERQTIMCWLENGALDN